MSKRLAVRKPLRKKIAQGMKSKRIRVVSLLKRGIRKIQTSTPRPEPRQLAKLRILAFPPQAKILDTIKEAKKKRQKQGPGEDIIMNIDDSTIGYNNRNKQTCTG